MTVKILFFVFRWKTPAIYERIWTPGHGIKPGSHWWEAKALTTAPSLLPKSLVSWSLPLISSRIVSGHILFTLSPTMAKDVTFMSHVPFISLYLYKGRKGRFGWYEEGRVIAPVSCILYWASQPLFLVAPASMHIFIAKYSGQVAKNLLLSLSLFPPCLFSPPV